MYLNVDLDRVCIGPDARFDQVVQRIEYGAKQVALVVSRDYELLGIITDGDVRRAYLAGLSNADHSASEIMQRSFVAGKEGMSVDEIMAIMSKHKVRHLPLVNNDDVVKDLVWISDLVNRSQDLLCSAVVMAGGYGVRMRPLTDDLPKPMLPLGGKPVMEHLIEQLKRAGIRNVDVATHYMSDAIMNHFGNGDRFGVDINYIAEDRPLGTAGALGLMPKPRQLFLVVNGDVVLNMDLSAMRSFHLEHNSDLTIGVQRYDVEVPYGVLECDGPIVKRISEKPTCSFFVNAGIYLLEPDMHDHIPKGQRFDMTDLIAKAIDTGCRVVSFPVMKYWMDIGQPADYQRARNDVKNGKVQS